MLKLCAINKGLYTSEGLFLKFYCIPEWGKSICVLYKIVCVFVSFTLHPITASVGGCVMF